MVSMVCMWIPVSFYCQTLQLNASHITNLGSLFMKLCYINMPVKNLQNPCMYKIFKFFSTLRVLFPGTRDYQLEKAILNLFVVIEQEVNTTMQTLGIYQTEVNS